MIAERMQEFIIMLLIENRCEFKDGGVFYEHISENYDREAFNKRYLELLDEFLKPYALNKTEKSD